MRLLRVTAAGALALSFPAVARAADVFIAEKAVGAGDGASCASAHDVAWFNAKQIAPGDVAHLCGVLGAPILVTASGKAGAPMTIFFEKDAKLSAPTWTAATGAIRATNASYLVIDGGPNGVIEATESGTAMQKVPSRGILLSGANHVEVKNLLIRNMYVRTSADDTAAGGDAVYVSGGSNIDIHDIVAPEAQTGIECVYPGAQTTSHVRLHRNTFSHVDRGIGVGSGGKDAIGDDVAIYENDIGDFANWDSPGGTYHHDGIYPFAAHPGAALTNLRVYSNYFHGDIGVNNTAWIFMTGIDGAEIYDNLFVGQGANSPSSGAIAVGGASKIYSNTIALLTNGICVNATKGSDIEDNIMYGCGTAIGLRGMDSSTRSNQNLFFGQKDGQGFATVEEGSGKLDFIADLAAWRSATKLDAQSAIADPLFVDPMKDFHLKAGSPAIDVGSADVGAVVTADKDGVTRPKGAGYDVGAYEYCNGDCLDAGVADPQRSACGCRLEASSSPASKSAILSLFLLLWVRRARRSSSPRFTAAGSAPRGA